MAVKYVCSCPRVICCYVGVGRSNIEGIRKANPLVERNEVR
jgi:hypothetical protein